jgi:hypothetical protein
MKEWAEERRKHLSGGKETREEMCAEKDKGK